MPELVLERVGKRYGAATVLRNVEGVLARGTVTLVTGGNGAGKSTLLKIMAGLSQPSSGRVLLRPESGASASGPRLGYVGHATFLYPELTALENLAFWRTAHQLRLNRDALLALLERVGLAEHAHERARVFRAAWRSGSTWPGCSCLRPTSCCSTNPPPDWTRRRATFCAGKSLRRGSAGPAWPLSAMILPGTPLWRIGCWRSRAER